jgi:hypothetical protein
MVADGKLVMGKRGRRPATSVSSIGRFRDEFKSALEQHWRARNENGVVAKRTRLWVLLNVPERPELLALSQETAPAVGPVTTWRMADLTKDELADLEARFPGFRR